MLKAAIAGCGAICRMHADSIQAAGARLAGAADPVAERAAALTGEYGGTAFDSFERMLDEARPDVLHICTPHHLHVSMAKAALERGIHVLTEKPLALSDADAAALAPIVKSSPALLGVCYQNRYVDPVTRAMAHITEGKLGRLLYIRGFVTWGRDEAYYTQSGWRGAWVTEGGGVMINQAVHTLDLLLYFAGMPRALSATTANHHLKGVIEVEDSAEIRLEFDGCTGVMYATTAFGADAPVLIDLYFEKGSLRVEGDNLTVRRQDDHADTASGLYQGKCCWGSGHPRLIRDFYDCIREGRAFPVDYGQARRVCRVLDGIYTSAKTGEAIVF